MGIENIVLAITAVYGLVGFIEGWIDGKTALNKKKSIEHKLSFTLRIFGSIGVWGLCFWCGLPLNPLVTVMMMLLNSIGVDLGFNKSYGNDLGYIGRTSEFDKFVRKTPIGGDGRLYQMCKLITAGILFFAMAM